MGDRLPKVIPIRGNGDFFLSYGSPSQQPADVAYAYDDQNGLPFGSALACAHQGIALGVFRVVGPTPL